MSLTVSRLFMVVSVGALDFVSSVKTAPFRPRAVKPAKATETPLRTARPMKGSAPAIPSLP
jgi:hypothetical protein